jgi:hypothetical protein
MATYIDRLKAASPEGYNKLSGLMSYTANEQYGGVPQDWQAQIFTNIDTSGVPKKMEYAEKPETRTAQTWDGESYSYEFKGIPAKGYQQEGYDTEEGTVVTGYLKDVKNVNGLNIKARYSPSGDLVGFVAPPEMRNWLSGNQSVSGAWDAEGNPKPVQYTSGGGGFFGGMLSDLGPVANIAAAYFGGPLGVAALNLAQGKNLEDSAKAAAITYAAQQALGGADAGSDPNAVGGVYGPDNIDVGGGWSPAAGATAAELEAARLALEPTSQVTANQITTDIAGDNIDAGGGWSPATGATEAELAQARAAMAANGWTFSEALNAVRGGLLVNALIGDPLGLGGGQPEQASAGSTGFQIVPVPTEWKSPTYATSAAPIDLESIFSNQNMLGGTQWQDLPSQRNMSFNDIFAAGQQQTPMGTPVDINQIVGSILGQTTTG